MFHIAMWRERMRTALTSAIEGGDYRVPGTADEINEAELANGIGTPLADAAARADHLLTEIIDLLDAVGDRKVNWFAAQSASEAVLRNSYSHPRRHMYDYLSENGDSEKARQLIDDSLSELSEVNASEYVTRILSEVRG